VTPEVTISKRSTKTTVTFRKPFVLPGFQEPFPAGDHIVETDEEAVEGVSFLAYQRVLTLLHVRGKHGPGMTVTIEPGDLDAALECDTA
jgi:hypothetical protein